jgi:hypothetical protein
MKTTALSTTANARSWKVVLLPVLVLILAGVLLWPEEDASPVEAPVTLQPPAARSPQQVTEAKSPANWPAADLKLLTKYSPFDPAPAPVAAPVQAQAQSNAPIIAQQAATKAAARDIIRSKVSAIYGTAAERIAVLGGKVVRVGDSVPEGTIVDITSSEVVVQAATSRP